MSSFTKMDLNNELFTMGLPLKLQRITSESSSDFDYPFTVAYNSNYLSTSESFNDTDEFASFELFYRHSSTISIIYCIAYFLVFLVGLVGNCFVIAVVFRMPRMYTVTNFFIANLALADVLVIVFCVPATLVSNLFVPWMLGWLMCKTVPYIQGVSVAASVYSLIAVSLDRFLAIWWPLKLQITKKRARLIIVGIWIIALGSTLPWLLYFDLVPAFPQRPDIQLCIEVWPQGTNGALYFLFANLIACYLLPMILISICYILIWIKVWRRDIPGDTKDAQMDRMQQKSKIKVVKMLVVVVILFVLSWLPLYVIFARIKLGGQLDFREEELLQIITPVAQWLGSSNSCINPILYAFFNKKYRRGFVAIIKSRKCCGRLRYYDTVTLPSSSASTRKSSHYHHYQSSTIKRTPYSPSIKSDAVSYIYDQNGGGAGGVGIRKHIGIVKQDSNLSRQMLLKQDSSVSSNSFLKQDSTVSARQILINNHNRASAEQILSRQDSNNSCRALLKQDSDGSRYVLSKQNSQVSYVDQRKKMFSKQDTEISFIETHKGSLSSQDSCASLIPTSNPTPNLTALRRKKLVKQDSIFSFGEPRSISEVKRGTFVKQDSVVSFADQPVII